LLVPNQRTEPPEIFADVNGRFGLKHKEKNFLIETEFSSPVISAFDVSSDENGVHLHKYQMGAETEMKENHGYVGNLDGTFFLLSDKHFPHIDKQTPEQDQTVQYDELNCVPGADFYPGCLVGTYILGMDTPLIDPVGITPPELGFFTYPFIFSVIIGLGLILWPFWSKIKETLFPVQKPYFFGDPIETTTSTTGLDHSGVATLISSRVEDENADREPTSNMSRLSTNTVPSTNSSSLKSIQVTENILGYGSHGTVVLEGSFDGKKVAVKRMLSEFYDVADHEVKMLQESDIHPNVVRYYYKEHCEGFMYMALEYCAGTISDLVTKRDIPEVHALNSLSYPLIFKQIMAGIQHLHSLSIVHRDLKPQNILISELKGGKNASPMPRILISDFGLGKRLADDQSSFHNTVLPGGGPAGTAGWRAPECLIASRAMGHGKDIVGLSGEWLNHEGRIPDPNLTGSFRITRSIDIFAAGCVFYYIVSMGNHPFGERFSREMNILKGNYRLQHLDNQKNSSLLKDLIRSMIMKDPRKRYYRINIGRMQKLYLPTLTFGQVLKNYRSFKISLIVSRLKLKNLNPHF
jgi:serine/threonine protein kinase